MKWTLFYLVQADCCIDGLFAIFVLQTKAVSGDHCLRATTSTFTRSCM